MSGEVRPAIRMRKKRFSIEQMIGVLKHAEVGTEVTRKAGISEQNFYRAISVAKSSSGR